MNRLCINCEREKEPKHFWVRWSPDLGYCYACLAAAFRSYEARQIEEAVSEIVHQELKKEKS